MTMENSLSILPASYDLMFLISKAGVINHYGYEAKEDGIHFRYQLDSYDAVQAAINSYPVDYLTVMVPQKLEAATIKRDAAIAAFTFNGMPIELDLETKANITGAVSGLDRNPDILSIEWSLGAGEFITLPRAAIYALADAAFVHVQACFANHKALADAIKAAADINVLEAIDLDAGWPA